MDTQNVPTSVMNAQILAELTRDGDSGVKMAQSAATNYTRIQIREDSFAFKILPPEKATDEMLDRDLTENLGIIWEKPVFVAYVRQQRYSRQMLDECREFTINVPLGDYDRKILGICGSKSGRDIDKIEAAGLTLVAPEVIGVPGLKELPLTLECRVLYRQEQESHLFNDEITRKFYTIETGDHICYYGEIVSAYIIED